MELSKDMKRRERKAKRGIKKEERPKDLKIYSLDGRLIFILEPGCFLDYQSLLRRKGEKTGYRQRATLRGHKDVS